MTLRAYTVAYAVLLAASAAFTSLWLDELHQLVGTYNKDFPWMLYWAQASPGGTPLNFVLQKLSVDALGFSSLAARLPAVAFGAGSLFLFGSIAREFVSGRWWLIALATFAFLPQIFRYGVEARPYSQGLFFALLAFRYWLRLDKEPSRKDAIAYSLAVAGGLYSQVFSVFVAAGQALWSLRNRGSRIPVIAAIAAAGLVYAPWYLSQRATQAVTQTMSNYSFSWQQISIPGLVRELTAGGYFCSIPLLILAGLGRDARLLVIAAAGIALPIAADATLGYFFAGRQLIFALPFLILMACRGLVVAPRWAAAVLLIPLFISSLRVDFRQATRSREDWATPAHVLARRPTCVYVWSTEQLQYLRVYEPGLSACDPNRFPDEFPFVTTRYSPPATFPAGYTPIRTEQVGITEIVTLRRDASLKTYGLSRFVFRTEVQYH